MVCKAFSGRYKLFIIAFLFAFIIPGYMYRLQLWDMLVRFYNLLSGKDEIKAFVSSFGMGAPVAFIFIQALQVLIAPVPGEATGFIGGYMFGTANGFFLSSIGLTIGSWLNFSVGRFLGKRYIRKLIPAAHFNRFDILLKRQGIIVLFILFVFPGFPKDYLCLFLGISTLPFQVFIALAAIGRMPGTLLLSYQGATLYQKMYSAFAVILFVCFVVAGIAIYYRKSLYTWMEKFNEK